VPEEEFLREDAAGGVDADGAVIFPVLQSGCHVREEGCAVDFVLVAGCQRWPVSWSVGLVVIVVPF